MRTISTEVKGKIPYGLRGSPKRYFCKVLTFHKVWLRLGSCSGLAAEGHTSQRNSMNRLGGLRSPEEIFTLIVDVEAPSRAAGAHDWNLRLGNTILRSEVCSLEDRVLGNLRNLAQLESGDLGSDEGEEDEERGEVLHGGGRRGSRLRTSCTC